MNCFNLDYGAVIRIFFILIYCYNIIIIAVSI